jgi:hypothetical protein
MFTLVAELWQIWSDPGNIYFIPPNQYLVGSGSGVLFCNGVYSTTLSSEIE